MDDVVREVVDRWLAAFTAGDIDELATLVHDDFVDHCPYPGMGADKAGFLAKARATIEAMPDVTYTLVDQVVEGDRVVDRFTVTATHTGEWMGAPPTGKALEFTVVDFLRFRDGKVVENWYLADTAAVMAQLGFGAC